MQSNHTQLCQLKFIHPENKRRRFLKDRALIPVEIRNIYPQQQNPQQECQLPKLYLFFSGGVYFLYLNNTYYNFNFN